MFWKLSKQQQIFLKIKQYQMIFQRLLKAWQTYGSIGLIRHLYQQKFPLHTSLVFQKNNQSSVCSVSGLTITRYRNCNQIDPVLRNRLGELKEGRIWREVNKLFLKRCELWLGQLEGQIVGMCWSLCREQRNDYFVPINESDAIILSCFIFPHYRGKRIFPTMLETMVNEMMEQDHVKDVYIDCKSWNIPSLRGIEKAGFTSIGQALRIVFLRKMKILRNNCHKLNRAEQ